MRIPRYRWFAWWYAAIAVGFALLGIVHAILGYTKSNVALHVAIAAGFAALSWMEFRSRAK